MAELPDGYKEVPPEDRAKAKRFFDQARTVAGTGNFEYAIEMYIQGLTLDPDAIDAHTELRDVSLKRKASGGKKLGMFEAAKLGRSVKDDKLNMLNAEKLLAYDPGETGYMLTLMQNAHRAGYYDTVMWIGPHLLRANADSKKPDFKTFMAMRDIYKALKEWRLAADATEYASRLRPLDQDIITELKNLGAMDAINKGNYEKRGSFRDSIKDMDKQKHLMDLDQDTHDLDAHKRLIKDAEAQHQAEPNDPGKFLRLIDVYEKTELPEYENKAVELLQNAFDTTKQFRYRQRIGVIHMRQMGRMERAKREEYSRSPNDAALKKEWQEVLKDRYEFELNEFQIASEAYPTDGRLRYELGRRMFELGRYNDAIPVFQQSRNDPKYRTDAGLLLGRSFYQAAYYDEADETLAGLIKDYPITGDDKSKEMYYWRARTLEMKELKGEALSHYSKLAQMDFNYLDVQARIKKLRSEGTTRA